MRRIRLLQLAHPVPQLTFDEMLRNKMRFRGIRRKDVLGSRGRKSPVRRVLEDDSGLLDKS